MSGAALALALAPTAAIATRPSVSPTYVIEGYKGFASEGNSSKPKLVARFELDGASNHAPGEPVSYGYRMVNLRLFTDCSPSRIEVPDQIGRIAATRLRASQRIHFKYRRHGLNIRGYFYGPVNGPSVYATARVTRPGCHDVLSFTATVPKL